MEIYGNRIAQTGKLFFSSRLLAIMTSNLNAVFPCLKKEESEAQKKDRSLIIYIHEDKFFSSFPGTKSEWTALQIVRTYCDSFQALLLPLFSVRFSILHTYSFTGVEWWKITFCSLVIPVHANQLCSGVLLDTVVRKHRWLSWLSIGLPCGRSWVRLRPNQHSVS